MREKYEKWLKTTGPRFLGLYKDKPLQDTVELYLDCLVDAKTSNTRESRLTNLFYAKAIKDKYTLGRVPKEVVEQTIEGRETISRIELDSYRECFDLEHYSQNSPSYQNGSYSRAIENKRSRTEDYVAKELAKIKDLSKLLMEKWTSPGKVERRTVD